MGQSTSGTLDLKGETRLDPDTESRQNKLFNDAGDMSRANLYENQYGIASDMPGMGRMTQRGQEYLTDSILGRGEYANNLGFTDYTRPEDAPVPTDVTVAANQAEMDARAQAQLEWQEQQYRNNQDSYDSNRAPRNYSKTVVNPYGGSMGLLTSGSGASQGGSYQGSGAPSGYGSSGVGIGEMQDAALATRNMLRERSPNPAMPQRINASSIAPTSVRGSTPIGQSTGSASALRGGGLDRSYAYDTMNAARGGVPPAGVSARSVTPDSIGGPLGLTPAELTERQLSATNLDAFDPSVSSTAIAPLSANAFAGEQSADEITSVGVDDLTGNPAAGEMTQAQLNALGIQKADTISPVGSVGVDPVTGQTTQAVDGVSPMDFGGSQTFGGTNSIQDYMNTAGVDAQIAQAKQDYNEALNVEKSRQAQVGAFGARGTVKEAGLIGDQERNIAQIRGAGFDRAAQMMEADAGRRQQAGLQGQQLGVQTGLAGQQLEAQRRESDAARAQQAAMQGQQLGFQGQLQSQQLTQAGDTRSAELTMQSQLQAQQLEAQRRESNAARTQQGALQTQQLGMQGSLEAQDLEARRLDANANRLQQAGIQTQQLGMQSGLAGQALQAQRAESNAARAQQAAMQGQQLGSQQAMQTQQLAQVGDIRNAELGLQADMQTQQLGMQGQMATQGLDADFEREKVRLGTQAAMQTQALGSDAYMQEQQLGTQVGLQNAQNEMRVAEQNQQAAIQRNDRQAVLDSQRQMENARMRLEAATRNQSADLQAAGMTYDANAQFRQQQLAAAGQLADIGGMTQDATFAGAGQLRQMGGEQDQVQRMQQAFDYEQWLRGQQGGAQSLALMQGFIPGGAQQQYERAPDLFGQLLGAGTSLAGAGLGAWGARGSTRGSTTGSEGP